MDIYNQVFDNFKIISEERQIFSFKYDNNTSCAENINRIQFTKNELEMIRNNLFNIIDKLNHFMNKYEFILVNKLWYTKKDCCRITYDILLYDINNTSIQFYCEFIDEFYFINQYEILDINEKDIIDKINETINAYNTRFKTNIELLNYRPINVKSAKY